MDNTTYTVLLSTKRCILCDYLCGYYVDKLAAPLLIDGETCVAIDGLDYQQIVNKIEYYSDPHRYRDLCDGAYEQFCKVVDFKKEQTDIELFLTKLV